MLRIRLRRIGKKGQPSYRIVVMDSRQPRDADYIDQVGFYNPRTDPATIELDTEKANRWLGNGAQPSEPVERMLRKVGLLERVVKDARAD
jgi:small subunit ribosomal protein S16